MSFDDTAGSAKTLAAVGFDIIRLFNAFESATIKDYQGLEADNFVEQQQRFELWANNIGLHQRGHASLDYRLRDAPAIHQYCQTLLEDLAKTLETCKHHSPSQVLEMPLDMYPENNDFTVMARDDQL